MQDLNLLRIYLFADIIYAHEIVSVNLHSTNNERLLSSKITTHNNVRYF